MCRIREFWRDDNFDDNSPTKPRLELSILTTEDLRLKYRLQLLNFSQLV